MILGPGFLALLGFVFALDAYLDRQHDWAPIESDPVFAWVPSGMHRVGEPITGHAFTPCKQDGRCEQIVYFAGPGTEASVRATVERELLAAGFARRPTTKKCPPGLRGADRFVRGDLSVWPRYGATPFPVSRSRWIPPSEGATAVRLTIDNMQVFWGC